MKRYLAGQFGKPSGPIGSLVATFLNRINKGITSRAVKALQIQATDKVLAIGFGGGVELSPMIKQASEGFVAGIEISKSMINKAKRRFPKQLRLGKVEFVEASVEAIPYKDDSFDKIITVNTIYFWPDPQKAFAEIKRVLKPDGMVVVGIRPKEAMQLLPLTKHGFILYSERDLEEQLDKAHFSNIKIECFEDKPLPAIIVVARNQ